MNSFYFVLEYVPIEIVWYNQVERICVYWIFMHFRFLPDKSGSQLSFLLSVKHCCRWKKNSEGSERNTCIIKKVQKKKKKRRETMVYWYNCKIWYHTNYMYMQICRWINNAYFKRKLKQSSNFQFLWTRYYKHWLDRWESTSLRYQSHAQLVVIW